jgi:hypothetical protein
MADAQVFCVERSSCGQKRPDRGLRIEPVIDRYRTAPQIEINLLRILASTMFARAVSDHSSEGKRQDKEVWRDWGLGLV